MVELEFKNFALYWFNKSRTKIYSVFPVKVIKFNSLIQNSFTALEGSSVLFHVMAAIEVAFSRTVFVRPKEVLCI